MSITTFLLLTFLGISVVGLAGQAIKDHEMVEELTNKVNWSNYIIEEIKTQTLNELSYNELLLDRMLRAADFIEVKKNLYLPVVVEETNKVKEILKVNFKWM